MSWNLYSRLKTARKKPRNVRMSLSGNGYADLGGSKTFEVERSVVRMESGFDA
jgi:hypothetical protein